VKRLAIFVIIALAGCRGPGGSSAGAGGSSTPGSSGSGSSAVAPAAKPGSESTSDTPNAQTTTATPATAQASPPVAQPKRSAEDSARFANAERAITEALATAKQAKTLKNACSGLDALMKTLEDLQQGYPPVGFERAFNEQRGGLVTMLDVTQSQDCADGSGLDADSIATELERLRREFVKLQQIGTKP